VGLVQGANWLHGGLPVWTVLPTLRPYMALRAAGGVLLWTSFLMFTYNIWATMTVSQPVVEPEIPVEEPLGPLPGTAPAGVD
jgi:cbb3-type cytochrome oxidase subunit 1